MSVCHEWETVRPISFVAKLAASQAFTALFREGMTLVEEAAAYLDGPGREQSKGLNRTLAIAYASESMRLTTRLMQLASWLLLQRAVNEGELSPAQAATEKHRVRLSRQDMAVAADIFDRLPERLRELSARSLRLQDEVMRLDALLYRTGGQPRSAEMRPTIHVQFERLRAAFEA